MFLLLAVGGSFMVLLLAVGNRAWFTWSLSMNYRGCKCLGCSSLSIWIWMEVALVNSANVCVRMFVSVFWCNLAYPSPLASIRQSLMDKHACIQKNTNWRFWIRHCLSLDSLSGSEINLYRLSSWIFFIFKKYVLTFFRIHCKSVILFVFGCFHPLFYL